MALKSEDLKFGELNEKTTISKFNEYFKTKLIKNQQKFGVIDFFNEDKSIYLELKSRRINHDKFPTALIGMNKIKYLQKINCDAYIGYKYDDGLFFIKYDKDLFNTFYLEKDYKRGYRADVGEEKSDVLHIPYTKLTKIN